MPLSPNDLQNLRNALQPLIGLRLDWLSIPIDAVPGFEPSQLAVLANTLADGALPQIGLLATDEDNKNKLQELGLQKAPREVGEREGYPDYEHTSGKRVELKGLFVDNPALDIKRPPTQREPSARIKENTTDKEVDPERDTLLVAAIQMQKTDGSCCPVIVDIEVFPMSEVVAARDKRLADGGGRWKGKAPQVVKKKSHGKSRQGKPLDDDDYEKDTNFGKLARIPYVPLVRFLLKHGAITKGKARGMGVTLESFDGEAAANPNSDRPSAP